MDDPDAGRVEALEAENAQLRATLRRLGEEVRRADGRADRLALGAAHELNNLMAAINGYGSMVKDARYAASDDAADIDELLRAAERGSRLCRELNAVGGRTFSQEDLDAVAVIEGLGPMLRRLLGPGIELEVLPSGGPAWVRFDRGELEQVVVNLVVNARESMPGGGQVVVGVSTAAGGPGTAVATRISVRDKGCGIAGDLLPDVFEPYLSGWPASHRGLGLAIVRGLVRAHGGAVSVESSSAGTAVHVDLPASLPESAESAAWPSVGA